MAEIESLPDAVARLIGDGDSVAMEGFTHLIPFAAGHEVLRQGRRELELIRMTPDLLFDQMIGAGGGPEIAACCGEVVVIAPHSPRTFVERLDFRITVGHGDGPGDRERLGHRLRAAGRGGPGRTEPASAAESEALAELLAR